MSPNPGLAIVGILLVYVFPLAVLSSGIPFTLNLRRAFPVPGREQLEAARTRDMMRHRRILQSVVDFQLQGSANPFAVGLYYTVVKLGFPPMEYHVQIDTGSDILWVNCIQCYSCPTSSGLDIALRLYDPQNSSSSSVLSCSDSICLSAIETAAAKCESQSCSYTFQYGDGSGTSGSYVSDTLTFDTVLANGVTTSSSITVTFGCSSIVSGDLTKPERAVDGILGFGQNHLSIVSQLASQKIASNAFSHCLRGSDNGGGIFVLGKIEDPGIVYSPLVPSMPHYNLYLESISVKGQALPISPTAFSSESGGTIIDSGTTLAYLAEEAYDPFVNSIVSLVGGSVQSFDAKGTRCFATMSSLEDVFPSVSLNFRGASMVLRPQDYLLQQGSLGLAGVWCIGWQKMQGSTTILGDIVLKDKVFVYDLQAQQVGWMNYDCSKAVNVSSTSGNTAFVQDTQAYPSGTSPSFLFDYYNPCLILISVLHCLLLSDFPLFVQCIEKSFFTYIISSPLPLLSYSIIYVKGAVICNKIPYLAPSLAFKGRVCTSSHTLHSIWKYHLMAPNKTKDVLQVVRYA